MSASQVHVPSAVLNEISIKGISREAEREIQRALRGLRFGTVEITVHDSQVVQVERREKIRLLRSSNG